MNQFDAKALMAKHKLQLQASMSHSDNPYHQIHIQEFTAYVDASVNSLAHEIMQQLPALIDQRIAATKVQMDVDEPAFRKAKAKFQELMSCFGKWGK